MKTIKSLFICMLIFVAITVTKGQSDGDPEITFEKKSHDFGNIKKGTDVTYKFIFKNTGKQPLVISNVVPSCDCAVPDWPKEPIFPNSSSVIKVVYSAENVGIFNKTITVMSDAKTNPVVLTIKGVVTE